jgi:hypothetical protein
MDGTRPGPLSDAALDRELDAAVNVDPSPEFVARIRLRVAAEPRRTGWRWQWRLAGAGVAVAAVALLAAGLWPATRSDERREAAARTPASRATRSEASEAAVPPPPRDTPRARSAPPREVPRRQTQAVDERSVRAAAESGAAPDFRPLPDVQVSADEVRAYEMLFAGVPRRSAPAAPPDGSAAAGTEPAELHDLAIMPLIIEPRPQMARLETGERP